MNTDQFIRRTPKQNSTLIRTQNANEAEQAAQEHQIYMAKKLNFKNRSMEYRKAVLFYGFNFEIDGKVYALFLKTCPDTFLQI